MKSKRKKKRYRRGRGNEKNYHRKVGQQEEGARCGQMWENCGFVNTTLWQLYPHVLMVNTSPLACLMTPWTEWLLMLMLKRAVSPSYYSRFDSREQAHYSIWRYTITEVLLTAYW